MNPLHFSYPIKESSPATIGLFLRQKGYSSHLIARLKREPFGIRLNGNPVFTSHPLLPGDLLEITLPGEQEDTGILPVPLPFPIIYEDPHLLVIDKPAGMPVHPSMGNHDNTLANAAAWYFHEKNEPFVFRAVNRLDRDTTGLLILARHSLSSCLLSDQSKKRQIHREYLALCTGLVPPSGTISAPIARKEGSVIERCVDFESGSNAVTHYRRLCYRNGLSLVQICLETGRTHQIRVHMKYIGHPLPGDFIYCPDYSQIGRQALHGFRLSFTHPITGKPLTFTSPLPADMRKALSVV